jgi:RNA polymerase sigma-70 factor (ECF subfamily)
VAEAEPEAIQPLLDARERFLAFLRTRIADPHLAEDLLQDSFLRALRAAPELKDEARLVPWFYRVLQNAVVDAYRRRGVARSRIGPLDMGIDVASPPGEDEAALCECFRELVPALKPEYAELVTALDLNGEAPEAAAIRLGITPNNLKVRRHRARQALRRRLEETCRVCAEHHCLDCTCRSGGSDGGRV